MERQFQISGPVAVLMATLNGARHLDAQLQSISNQTYPSIDIWVSDDGSSDGTSDLLESWKRRWDKGRFTILAGPRKGFAENFRALILNTVIDADVCSFSDQDDEWELDKVQKSVDALRQARHDSTPTIFCARTATINEAGKIIGHSRRYRRPPSFANALVQSIGGGNTMSMNRAARELLVDASRNHSFASHDWWAYQLVTGTGGQTIYSEEPLVRYRQHASNIGGANTTLGAPVARLKRLFRGVYRDWVALNVDGLNKNRSLLTDDAKRRLDHFTAIQDRSIGRRLTALKASGVHRQTVLEDLAFRLSVILGKL